MSQGGQGNNPISGGGSTCSLSGSQDVNMNPAKLLALQRAQTGRPWSSGR